MLTEKIYDAWGVIHTLPGLYDEFPIFYRLQHFPADGSLGESLIIRQPIGWDALKIVLLRDMDWGGVNEERTDSKTPATFDGYSGRDFIEQIFRVEGEDALIILQTGIKNGDEYITEYEGCLNFSTYKRSLHRISVGLERKSLKNKLLARWDAPFSLTPTLKVPLSPQALKEQFLCLLRAGKRAEQTFPGDTNGHLWLQFDTGSPQTAEIEEFAAGKPIGLSDSEGPVVNDEWLFKFRSSGIFTVSIDLQYRIWWTVKKRTVSVGAARVTAYSVTTVLLLVRADGTHQEFPVTVPMAESRIGNIEITLVPLGRLQTSIEVKKGDKLFLYGLVRFSHNKNELQQTQAQLTMITQRISISGQSKNVVTSALGATLFEVIDTGIQQATDVYNRLRSGFYGLSGPVYAVSGPGAERVLVNGFSIRQFTGDHPMKLSLRDLLNSLQAIDGIGLAYGTETDLLGHRDTLEIKPYGDFFRPVELLRLDSVSDYQEEVIELELYSSLEIGYAKWVDEGSNALEEVFTTHQLTTPIRTERAKKTLVSKLITSALAIERTRREQFADSPKDGTAFDDEVFLIQCKPTPTYAGPIRFYQGAFNDIIEVPQAIDWISVGMFVVIGGSSQNDYPYKVTFISDAGKTPWTFYVDGGQVFSNESVANGRIAPSQLSPLTPETGADLSGVNGVAVTGLAAADSTYNLRLTPGRMLFASAPLWSGCLVDKGADELVSKVKIPQNNNLMSTIEGAAPRRVREATPVAVDELYPYMIYRPRQQSYSVRLSRQQMHRLRLGLTGKLPNETDDNGQPINRNYGYVSCLDETGVRVAGYVTEAAWSPDDERVTFKLRQTALDLNDTTSGLNCAQFAGWTIDQAQLADDRTRRRIELCTYVDVDVL